MRPELRDRDIERELGRRAEGEWRSERVLAAVRRGMELRTERVAAPRWAALAGLLGLLGAVVVLAVALPRLDLGPSAGSPSPSPASPVLSTEEFAARLSTGELNGSTVVVEGAIEPIVRLYQKAPPPCGPAGPDEDDECLDELGMLSGTEVRVGKRYIAVPENEATIHGGPRGGWQWWDSAEAPIEGTLVLLVSDPYPIAYLGRVSSPADGRLTVSASGLTQQRPEDLALDEVLLVDAWLGGRAEPVYCQGAEEFRGLPSRRCQGGESWLAADEDPDTDRIRVQYGAYGLFSRGPGEEQLDRGPRRATYAVARRLIGGGCLSGEPPCWEWEIIGALWYSDPADGDVPPYEPRPGPPTPSLADPTRTPSPEPPAGLLTCRPYVMAGPELSPAPVWPVLDARLIDRTESVVDCAYFSDFAILRQGPLVQTRWHDLNELGLAWNVAHVCPSSTRLELSRIDDRYVVTVDQPEVEDCGAAAGRQAVVIWFDGPVQGPVDASMVDADQSPPD